MAGDGQQDIFGHQFYAHANQINRIKRDTHR